MRTTGRATCKELLRLGSSTLDCPMGSPARYIICILYTCYVCDLLSTGSHKYTRNSSGIGGSSRLGSGSSSYSYRSVVLVVVVVVVIVV